MEEQFIFNTNDNWKRKIESIPIINKLANIVTVAGWSRLGGNQELKMLWRDLIWVFLSEGRQTEKSSTYTFHMNNPNHIANYRQEK